MNLAAFDNAPVIASLEWLFISYFLLLHGGHALLTAVSMNSLRRRMESIAVKMLPRLSSGYEIPVSIIVPISATNRDAGQFVQDLFDLDYPQFEVIVVTDTTDTETLARLKSALQLAVFPEAYWRQVRARQVRGVYRSPRFPALRVVDKDYGGPGDAINAGVNTARYPIVCIAQPGCVLKRDSLRRLIPDFLEDATTIAAGPAERVANGSFIVNGFLERCRLYGNPLVWIQANAALRRDLCARHGWAAGNAMLAFSDRFCAFRKDAVVRAGGFARSARNPVLELLARLHRLYRAEDKPYRIAFLPAPIVWRFAATAPGAICQSIAETHRDQADALKSNRQLFWRRNGGAVGRLAYPFAQLTEVARPSIELLALVFFVSAYALDLVSGAHLIAFAICAAGLGILLSWLAILLDAFIFRTYRSGAAYALLFVAAVFENIGYRQLAAICALTSFRRQPPARGNESDRPKDRRHQTG
ncbi:MAG TPA: glycosyltransferase family 2 protein [Burkholderiales bacterium]|nr:glycosyltransferase family 2 protein [Burkholderiales bacterium]